MLSWIGLLLHSLIKRLHFPWLSFCLLMTYTSYVRLRALCLILRLTYRSTQGGTPRPFKSTERSPPATFPCYEHSRVGLNCINKIPNLRLSLSSPVVMGLLGYVAGRSVAPPQNHHLTIGLTAPFSPSVLHNLRTLPARTDPKILVSRTHFIERYILGITSIIYSSSFL